MPGFRHFSQSDRAMSGDVTTSREAIPGTSNVNVDTFQNSVNEGPDSTSDRDKEPLHETGVDNIYVYFVQHVYGLS